MDSTGCRAKNEHRENGGRGGEGENKEKRKKKGNIDACVALRCVTVRLRCICGDLPAARKTQQQGWNEKEGGKERWEKPKIHRQSSPSIGANTHDRPRPPALVQDRMLCRYFRAPIFFLLYSLVSLPGHLGGGERGDDRKCTLFKSVFARDDGPTASGRLLKRVGSKSGPTLPPHRPTPIIIILPSIKPSSPLPLPTPCWRQTSINII